jgi:pimeloyl-ACP methyl ester carboxylesterase/DNA-binding SARP family transcriptional activator
LLKINTIGALTVEREGAENELPASRKTRALLAYLALEPGEHSRQFLCELLWQVPDDPRAALRWSLSKLRGLLNLEDQEVVAASRNCVQLIATGIETDLGAIARCAKDPACSPKTLEANWKDAQGVLLEDCEIPNQPEFSAWIAQQRSNLETQRSKLAQLMASHPQLDPARQDRWAQRLLALDRFDHASARLAVAAKRAVGQVEAADKLQAQLSADFLAAGLDAPIFDNPGPANFPPQTPYRASSFGQEEAVPDQKIQFVRSDDDVTIAWASAGNPNGPPLVKAAKWLTHMELDWQAPIWSPLYRDLSRSHRFVRYDERGCGLSDWDASDISLESFVADLKQVADAAGLDRFPLLGISQGAAVSIEFAARFPDRVSHLVLFGGYDCGWRHTASEDEVREREAVMVLTESGWGRENPVYRRMFSQTFMPDASPEELEWFDEFQRQTTSPKNAVLFLEAFSQIDVRERLSDVQCPTLVLHSRGG